MNNISKYRKKANLKQKELAKKCGWNSSRLSNYETGIRSPSISNINLIIEKLNECGVVCDFESLFPKN